MLDKFARGYLAGLEACFCEISYSNLQRIVDILLEAHQNGRTVFVFGNGGSAATASHMACDLSRGTAVPGMPRLRAISLTDNVAVMTACANDENYEAIFKDQLVTLLAPGDVVIAITASGNSPNVLRAVEYANAASARTIGLIGFGGGKLRNMVEVDITVSSRDYGQVEDFHLSLDHILSQYLKQQMLLRLDVRKLNALVPSAIAD